MSVFSTWRKRLSKFIAPAPIPRVRLPKTAKANVPTRRPIDMMRMYAAARPSRLTVGWGSAVSSEDGEASTSLRTLRARSRELIRDSAYAKRAKVIVQNNVIGSGIGLQAKVMTTRGSLNQRINDDIERGWENWMIPSSCHTGGSLHFSDFERACIGQVFEAGEIFVRKHYVRFGDSEVPLAVELIEPERIADDFQPEASSANNKVILGIEVDGFHRPQAYWIRTTHPGELRLALNQTARIERVPASDILHLRLIDRWPSTHGVPWLHAGARRLNDMDGLSEAEIVASRAAACYMGFIETPSGETQYGETAPDGSKVAELEPAMVEHLAPGEKFTYAAPNRPNTSLDPFMRLMLREVAAAVGVSYESLSRDYSQSNYSSSRLSLLDDRDLWRMLQLWFIRSFRLPLHKVWLQQAILAGALPSISIADYALRTEQIAAVHFKPRGWSWVDPTKEVEAYKEAVRCGFITVQDVIAQTGNGRDLEDVLTERADELEQMHQQDLIFDTDPAVDAKGQKPQAATASQSAEPTDTTMMDGSMDGEQAVYQAQEILKMR